MKKILSIFTILILCGSLMAPIISATSATVPEGQLIIDADKLTSTSASIEYSYLQNDSTNDATINVYDTATNALVYTTTVTDTSTTGIQTVIVPGLTPSTTYRAVMSSGPLDLDSETFITAVPSLSAEGAMSQVNATTDSVTIEYYYKFGEPVDVGTTIQLSDPSNPEFDILTTTVEYNGQDSITGTLDFTGLEKSHVYVIEMLAGDGSTISPINSIYVKTTPFVPQRATGTIEIDQFKTTSDSFTFSYLYRSNSEDITGAKIEISDSSGNPVGTPPAVVDNVYQEGIVINGLEADSTYKVGIYQKDITGEYYPLDIQYVTTKPAINKATGSLNVHTITSTTAEYSYIYRSNDQDIKNAAIGAYPSSITDPTISDFDYIKINLAEGGEDNVLATQLTPDTNYNLVLLQDSQPITTANFQTAAV